MALPAMDVSAAIGSLIERKEKLYNVFSELERKKSLLSKLGAYWKDIEDYLAEVEANIRSSLAEISTREKSLETKMKEAKQALDKRELEVSAKEQASASLVQDKKDAAVSVILEMKRKWQQETKEEIPKTEEIPNESPAVNPNDVATGNGLASLAMDVDSKPETVTLSLSGLLEKEAASAPAQKSVGGGSNVITPRPQLKALCEAMDSDKLRLFIAEHRKDLNALSSELPPALKCAPDPAQLVLNGLQGYHHPSDASHGPKKDTSLAASKRACVIMLEALADILPHPDVGTENVAMSEEVKKSARQIADSWKSKFNLEVDLASNMAIDAQSFLQLLATFGLASEYDQDELCKLVLPITRRKQTPALCRVLGLSSKVPDVIDGLIKDGKQIEALSFATEFDLLDCYQPVPLLKAYLRDCRKIVHNTLKSGNNATAAQNDANQKELSALKVVLKTISDLNLEEKFPPGPLEKKVAQLEKAKVDRKRSAANAKPQQMKRPRTHIGATGGVAHDKSFYRPHDNRHQYGHNDAVLPFNVAGQPGYDRHLYGGYSTSYSSATRSPVSLSSSYMYPSDPLGSLGYGSSTYTGSTPSGPYSGYGFGTGLPSGYQSYH